MTFDKPTFEKPYSATIADIDLWDIYQGGCKIGTILKTDTEIHLDVMYNKHVLKLSERASIMTIIEMHYTKIMLHVLSSIKECEVKEVKDRIDGITDETNGKWCPEYKVKPLSKKIKD